MMGCLVQLLGDIKRKQQGGFNSQRRDVLHANRLFRAPN